MFDDDIGFEENLIKWKIGDTQEMEKIEAKKEKSSLALPPPHQEQSQKLSRD